MPLSPIRPLFPRLCLARPEPSSCVTRLDPRAAYAHLMRRGDQRRGAIMGRATVHLRHLNGRVDHQPHPPTLLPHDPPRQPQPQ